MKAKNTRRGRRRSSVGAGRTQSDLTRDRQLQKRDHYHSYAKKRMRWSLELLHTAVCGHRWDEAFLLLPCVITQMAPHLSVEFLWRMTDVITRNIPSISVAERKKFWSLVHNMKMKRLMFLDILSQDLATATDKDADELLQMIEDIQNQRQCPGTKRVAMVNRRFQALSDGYVGLIHYNRWKSSVETGLSSQSVDDEPHTVSFSESQETSRSESSRKEMARKAHSFLKRALSNLDEPCEWFMIQYFELEAQLNGQEAAVSALERYKSDPRRAPAHHLAYHFYKTFVPASTEQQLVELEHISRESPDDPLVVELVNLYLSSLDHGGPALERAMVWGSGVDSDSGLEDSDDSVSGVPTVVTCALKSRGRVEVLYRCLVLLVAMLDYPDHVWDLKAWQKLTEVLGKFYQAWIRCWSCLSCKSTRRRLHRLAGTVVPLWRHYVWRKPPTNLTQSQAQVLIHHVFAAFIFSCGEDYKTQALSALEVNGYVSLKEELLRLMNVPGPNHKNFNIVAERNRKRLENVSLRMLSHAVCEDEDTGQQDGRESEEQGRRESMADSSSIDSLITREEESVKQGRRRNTRASIVSKDSLCEEENIWKEKKNKKQGKMNTTASCSSRDSLYEEEDIEREERSRKQRRKGTTAKDLLCEERDIRRKETNRKQGRRADTTASSTSKDCLFEEESKKQGREKNTKANRPSEDFTLRENRKDSSLDEEGSLQLITPVRDSATISEKGELSPRSLSGLDMSFDGDFVTSTQVRDEKDQAKKKALMVNNPELNGSFFAVQGSRKKSESVILTNADSMTPASSTLEEKKMEKEEEHIPQKTKNIKNLLGTVARSKKSDVATGMLKDKEKTKQHSSQNNTDGNTPAKSDSRARQTDKLPKAKTSTPLSNTDPLRRTRLSRRRIFQVHTGRRGNKNTPSPKCRSKSSCHIDTEEEEEEEEDEEMEEEEKEENENEEKKKQKKEKKKKEEESEEVEKQNKEGKGEELQEEDEEAEESEEEEGDVVEMEVELEEVEVEVRVKNCLLDVKNHHTQSSLAEGCESKKQGRDDSYCDNQEEGMASKRQKTSVENRETSDMEQGEKSLEERDIRSVQEAQRRGVLRRGKSKLSIGKGSVEKDSADGKNKTLSDAEGTKGSVYGRNKTVDDAEGRQGNTHEENSSVSNSESRRDGADIECSDRSDGEGDVDEGSGEWHTRKRTENKKPVCNVNSDGDRCEEKDDIESHTTSSEQDKRKENKGSEGSTKNATEDNVRREENNKYEHGKNLRNDKYSPQGKENDAPKYRRSLRIQIRNENKRHSPTQSPNDKAGESEGRVLRKGARRGTSTTETHEDDDNGDDSERRQLRNGAREGTSTETHEIDDSGDDSEKRQLSNGAREGTSTETHEIDDSGDDSERRQLSKGARRTVTAEIREQVGDGGGGSGEGDRITLRNRTKTTGTTETEEQSGSTEQKELRGGVRNRSLPSETQEQGEEGDRQLRQGTTNTGTTETEEQIGSTEQHEPRRGASNRSLPSETQEQGEEGDRQLRQGTTNTGTTETEEQIGSTEQHELGRGTSNRSLPSETQEQGEESERQLGKGTDKTTTETEEENGDGEQKELKTGTRHRLLSTEIQEQDKEDSEGVEFRKGAGNRILVTETQTQSQCEPGDSSDTQLVQETESQSVYQENITNLNTATAIATPTAATTTTLTTTTTFTTTPISTTVIDNDQMRHGEGITEAGLKETSQEEEKLDNPEDYDTEVFIEPSQSPFSLTPGQREGDCPTPQENLIHGSQFGQEFFLSQEQESEAFLLSLVGKELQAGSSQTGNISIHDISLEELNVIDLADLDPRTFPEHPDRSSFEVAMKEIPVESGGGEGNGGNETDETPDDLVELSQIQSPVRGSDTLEVSFERGSNSLSSPKKACLPVSSPKKGSANFLSSPEEEHLASSASLQRESGQEKSYRNGIESHTNESQRRNDTSGEESGCVYPETKSRVKKRNKTKQMKANCIQIPMYEATCETVDDVQQNSERAVKEGKEVRHKESNANEKDQEPLHGVEGGIQTQQNAGNVGQDSPAKKTCNLKLTLPSENIRNLENESSDEEGSSSENRASSERESEPEKGAITTKCDSEVKSTYHTTPWVKDLSLPSQHKNTPADPKAASCLGDLSTPCMLDITKNSDSSTPNRSRKKRRQGRPSCPAWWLDGLPLPSQPSTANNTPKKTGRDTDTHETELCESPHSVVSDSPSKKLEKSRRKGMPLSSFPSMTDTTNRTNRNTDTHGTTLCESPDVVSDSSRKLKKSRRKDLPLPSIPSVTDTTNRADSNTNTHDTTLCEAPDIVLSDSSLRKLEKSRKKKKFRQPAPIDHESGASREGSRNPTPVDFEADVNIEVIEALRRDWASDVSSGKPSSATTPERNEVSERKARLDILPSEMQQHNEGNKEHGRRIDLKKDMQQHASLIGWTKSIPRYPESEGLDTETSTDVNNTSVNKTVAAAEENQTSTNRQHISSVDQTEYIPEYPESSELDSETSTDSYSIPIDEDETAAGEQGFQRSEIQYESAVVANWTRDLPLPKMHREGTLQRMPEEDNTSPVQMDRALVSQITEEQAEEGTSSSNVEQATREENNRTVVLDADNKKSKKKKEKKDKNEVSHKIQEQAEEEASDSNMKQDARGEQYQTSLPDTDYVKSKKREKGNDNEESRNADDADYRESKKKKKRRKKVADSSLCSTTYEEESMNKEENTREYSHIDREKGNDNEESRNEDDADYRESKKKKKRRKKVADSSLCNTTYEEESMNKEENTREYSHIDREKGNDNEESRYADDAGYRESKKKKRRKKVADSSCCNTTYEEENMNKEENTREYSHIDSNVSLLRKDSSARKKKSRKNVRQEEVEENNKDDKEKRMSANISGEECDRGKRNIREDGNDEDMRQGMCDESDKERNLVHINQGERKRDTRDSSANSNNPEFTPGRKIKEQDSVTNITPYTVETVWHSAKSLTVRTVRRKEANSGMQDLVQHGTKPSKRQKIERESVSHDNKWKMEKKGIRCESEESGMEMERKEHGGEGWGTEGGNTSDESERHKIDKKKRWYGSEKWETERGSTSCDGERQTKGKKRKRKSESWETEREDTSYDSEQQMKKKKRRYDSEKWETERNESCDSERHMKMKKRKGDGKKGEKERRTTNYDNEKQMKMMDMSRDSGFSITVCNQIDRLSDIKITLYQDSEAEESGSKDGGIKVQVHFTERPEISQDGGHISDAGSGGDGSGGSGGGGEGQSDDRLGMVTSTPCGTPSRSRKVKLFEDD